MRMQARCVWRRLADFLDGNDFHFHDLDSLHKAIAAVDLWRRHSVIADVFRSLATAWADQMEVILELGGEITFNGGSHDDTSSVSLWLGRSKVRITLDRPLYLIRSLCSTPNEIAMRDVVCLMFVCSGGDHWRERSGQGAPPKIALASAAEVLRKFCGG
jgi:hypothetical protein